MRRVHTAKVEVVAIQSDSANSKRSTEQLSMTASQIRITSRPS